GECHEAARQLGGGELRILRRRPGKGAGRRRLSAGGGKRGRSQQSHCDCDNETHVMLRSFRGRPKAGTRNPDTCSALVSGFRVRSLHSRPGMTDRNYSRRWRTKPSWATEATSVPSRVNINPREKPREPCR